MDFILTIAAIHLVGCLSPGPDIFLVVFNSMRHGWRSGVLTTFGILCGVSLQITLGLTGISYLITQGEGFQTGLSLAGGAWLLYLGLKGLRSCRQPPAEENARGATLIDRASFTLREAWFQGFLVNVLNPKALLYFLSLFSVMLGPDLPLGTRVASGIVMVCVQALAFSAVAFLVDRPRFRQNWQRLQLWLELGISIILLVLGGWIWLATALAVAN